MDNTELWEFKYAPKTFDEIILDDSVRGSFKESLESIPNMTLAGPPGIGKGTFMEVLMNQPDLEVLRINGSDETGVDGIRSNVKPFAESVGFSNTLKVVYLNEADRLSTHAQDMLRDLIEKVHDLTRFILVCNHPDRITKEVLSRCPLVMFPDPPLKGIAEKCINILKAENVKYDTKDVISLVKNTYPDIRHTINMLKYNVVDGVLSGETTIVSVDKVYDSVLNSMKSCDPGKVRKTLRSNPIDYTRLYSYLYDKIMDSDDDVFKNDMIAILTITEGAYRNDIVSIQEISFMNMYFKLLQQNAI